MLPKGKPKGTCCSVEGCHNRSLKEDGVIRQYFRLPAVIQNQGEACKALSEERRRVWLANLKKDFTGKNLSNIRVCSDHFVSKKKAYLHDHTNPDWAPTINMGYTKGANDKLRSVEAHSRYVRKVNRHKKTNAATALLEFSKQVNSDTSIEEAETGIATQTVVDLPLFQAMMAELQTLRTENIDLKQQVLKLKSQMDISKNKKSKKPACVAVSNLSASTPQLKDSAIRLLVPQGGDQQLGTDSHVRHLVPQRDGQQLGTDSTVRHLVPQPDGQQLGINSSFCPSLNTTRI